MLIKNTNILNEFFEIEKDVDLYIENEWIRAIGHDLIISDPDIFDGSGVLFMPGLIDAHTHCGQQLLKGSVLDAQGLIWQNIMLPFESSLDEATMKLNASLCALEMIRNGTTSFMDAGSYHMDVACDVFGKSGLRGNLTRSTMDDLNLPLSIRESVQEAIEKNRQLYKHHQSHETLEISYSLRSLLSVSEELILAVGKQAKKDRCLIQAHMNEYQKEVDVIRKKRGLSPYEYLESLGVLDHNFVGAHSLILTKREYEILKKYDISVVHCPFSNSGKALADIQTLRAYGINVALGSDGVAHGGLSLFNEMRQYRCMMKVTNLNSSVLDAKELLKIATVNGAKAMHKKYLGQIKTGYLADMIGIDLQDIAFAGSQNWLHSIVESTQSQSILHSMVHGKWLMKDRQILTLDEKKILKAAQDRSCHLC